MKQTSTKFIKNIAAISFALIFSGFNAASANFGFGDKVDAECKGMPSFESLDAIPPAPVYGGINVVFDEADGLVGCENCHTAFPNGSKFPRQPQFGLYENKDYLELCKLKAPKPDCTDNDLDGYSIEGGACGLIDCNDNNRFINPGAVEICTDGIDNNCSGLIDLADPVCSLMPDEERLQMLKDKIKQHKRDCKATEKKLKKEYESLKKQIEQNEELYKQDDDEDEDEDDEDDEDEEDDKDD